MKESIVLRAIDVGDIQNFAFIERAAQLLQKLVLNGAAIGWVEPPSTDEVVSLLRELSVASERGDACLLSVWVGPDLAGLGYWRRYNRPTHRPNADIEKVAVDPRYQGRGLGRKLVSQLISEGIITGIEVLTLDFRGDNERAAKLYRSLGFTEYGRLPRFVAVGTMRYDKVLYAIDLR
ncbi:GNAT family N-acetyltransferase [Bacillus salipaludis]|uniref:GNAT family N-acetyltransferase n=1 Tax=Bacillus salipaludis TaxID=2547811 RepID=UPI002E24C40B|nr:GNAT family N-acetyltransferase [Bacillus salipaludis]